MNIAVLGNPTSWYVADLERAAKSRGHRLHRLDFRRLVAAAGIIGPSGRVASPVTAEGEELARLDALIVRTMPPGSLEQVVYRMDALGRLEAAGVPVINSPRSLECAVDKYLTTARLCAAGLPVPPTIVCEDSESAMLAFEQLGGDVVVKPLFGSEGRGIVRISDPDLAFRTFRTLERIDAVLYLQQYIEHEGFDVRILMLDGHPLAAMRRRSPGDFRTNIARAAVGEPHEPTEQEVDYATRAVASVGTRIAGVDLLWDRRGECHVIEVNAVPGWRALTRVTGIDVADRFLASMEHRPK